MLDRIQETLITECQLPASKTVLVGVSGGPDSLCLLDAMRQLGYPLIVAHLNHGLRAEARADAQRVKEFAGQLEVPFISAEADVGSIAGMKSLSIEEAARTARYEFLFAKAREFGAQAVAVGHTADDQVETVLMHLLRGAGLSGLKGMEFRALPNSWSQEIPLVRPLLSTWRSEVLEYLAGRDLQPVLDRTNLDTTIYRNRLRHELIPYLESYQPAVRPILWRMAQILGGDFDILEQVVARTWQDCILDLGPGYVSIRIEEFSRLPVGLKRHLLRRAMAVLRPGLRDIDFGSVERALGFLARPPHSRQQDLVANLRLLQEDNLLWVADWDADLPHARWPQLQGKAEVELNVPGELNLPAGWRFQATLAEDRDAARSAALANRDSYQAWIDLDQLSLPLKIRNRRAGDRFRPLGLGGHSIKLAEFMVNVKLDRRARSAWPLVCAGNAIIWVPGFRIGHPFRLRKETLRVAHLNLVREVDR
ncbi:MAG TPA: tRNA lysidine(34) synthetase TilS [Anaerolineales bacterium]|jgi:tRNA(Ile)-lysidine synthase|nr:tRNA lysidine(34) synthetase TilS [Anaerolineales bacterium]